MSERIGARITPFLTFEGKMGLSREGKVHMPLNAYGFSARFVWVNDQFGVSWQLNLATDKVA